MKKEIADKWIIALRSGKYQQGTGSLKKNNEFCCLGVLCDISNLGNWSEASGHIQAYVSNGLNSLGTPTQNIIDWAGMTHTNGKYGPGLGNHLTTQNDAGKTFDEIADIIEKHWKEL